jgi:hypothetical protein
MDRHRLEICKLQLSWYFYSPMHEHATAAIKSLLYELVGLGEMCQEVLVVNVVNFDHHVSVRTEQIPVQRQAQHRQDVCDIGLLESIAPAQREHAASPSSVRKWLLPRQHVPADIEVQTAGDSVKKSHNDLDGSTRTVILRNSTSAGVKV